MARYLRIKLWRKWDKRDFYKQKQMCILNRIMIRTLNMPSKIANHIIMVTFKTTIIKPQLVFLFPIKISFKFKINDKRLRKKFWFQNWSRKGNAAFLTFYLISERDICSGHGLSSECTVTVKNIISTTGFFP